MNESHKAEQTNFNDEEEESNNISVLDNDLQGNPYELHFLLQSLRSGGISFEDFMVKAVQWSTQMLANPRRLHCETDDRKAC